VRDWDVATVTPDDIFIFFLSTLPAGCGVQARGMFGIRHDGQSVTDRSAKDRLVHNRPPER
jgi:hypothetical protein